MSVVHAVMTKSNESTQQLIIIGSRLPAISDMSNLNYELNGLTNKMHFGALQQVHEPWLDPKSELQAKHQEIKTTIKGPGGYQGKKF